MKSKTLILIRHGHRDKTAGREKDNGLSPKGMAQAKELGRFFRFMFKGQKPVILSSPRARCIETVTPLAKIARVTINVSSLLIEEEEGSSAYRKRIQEFYSWWRGKSHPLIVACSHGDWIPDFLELVMHTRIDVKKGSWVELELEEEEVVLSRLIQHFNRSG